MNTLTQRLNVDRLLLQAPMAGSQGSALALAVCGAGGIGALPAAMLTPEALVQELHLLAVRYAVENRDTFFPLLEEYDAEQALTAFYQPWLGEEAGDAARRQTADEIRRDRLGRAACARPDAGAGGARAAPLEPGLDPRPRAAAGA